MDMSEDKENNDQPVHMDFAISRTTSKLLAMFRSELARKTGQTDLTIPEAIAFIIEDYTKSYYGDLRGANFR